MATCVIWVYLKWNGVANIGFTALGQFCSELPVFLQEGKYATKKHYKCQKNVLSINADTAKRRQGNKRRPRLPITALHNAAKLVSTFYHKDLLRNGNMNAHTNTNSPFDNKSRFSHTFPSAFRNNSVTN